MTKSMLIDAAHLEETRILTLEDNKIEDLDFESSTKEQLRGNIYLAKVSRVEPSLRAAFVDYGNNRHGFLPFNEIHPDYFQIPVLQHFPFVLGHETPGNAVGQDSPLATHSTLMPLALFV